jgi:hypothetical protein
VHYIRQIAAVAVASGVAVASLAAPSAAAKATTPATTNPAAAAAGYLARQLVGPKHDHYTGSFKEGKKTVTFVNYGETADAILSMDAAGVAQAAAARATRYLEEHVRLYAGKSAATYAPGPIGKLLLVAEAQHVDIHSFGVANLTAELASTEGVRGASPGEYQQNPAGTPAKFDFFSTVSQALGVLSLADDPNTGRQPTPAAVTFLAGQQCKNGGYPTQLLSNPVTACASGQDVDSTAYAVQALIAAGSHTAAAKGLAWLHKAEHVNGSFGTPANANSTALALEALIDAHRSRAKPAAWLVSHQIGCSGSVAHRGAVAFEKKYDASALLATSQAGAALAGKPLAWIDKSSSHAAAPVLSCAKQN